LPKCARMLTAYRRRKVVQPWPAHRPGWRGGGSAAIAPGRVGRSPGGDCVEGVEGGGESRRALRAKLVCGAPAVRIKKALRQTSCALQDPRGDWVRGRGACPTCTRSSLLLCCVCRAAVRHAQRLQGTTVWSCLWRRVW